MTQEEKVKAYDKALEIAKKFYNDEQVRVGMTPIELEEIFPELAESEDEKIRKELLEHCKNQAKPYIQTGNKCPQIQSWISWLEKQGKNNMGISEATKQKLEDNLNKALAVETGESWNKFLDEHKPMTGSKFKVGDKVVHKGTGKLWTVHWYIKEDNVYSVEDSEGLINIYSPDVLELVEQKPADKAEPKFKVDDWIVYEENTYQIHNISLKRYYECLRTDGTVHTFDFEYIDSKSHIWTIQDTKDGEVLYECNEKKPFIFKELKHIDDITSYCDIFNGIFNPNEDSWTTWDIVPATKEQRDLLFQKIKEAGYKWDAEKKELKKIEQNSTDEIGNYDHEEVLQTIINEQKPAFEMKTPEESLGIDSDTYNKIVDECIYGEQKPVDKVEPKFHEGEWITIKE